MRSSFNKEILRSITRSAGRFIAIAIISLLGAGFYAGLRMAAPDMRIAGDEFFDATSMYDISVVSTLGFDDESLEVLAGVEGVGEVMPAYRSDAMVKVVAADGSESLLAGSSYAACIESLCPSARSSDTSDGLHALSDDASYLNRPLLVEGTWPTNARECVVGVTASETTGVHIGDTLAIEKATADLEDVFAQTHFTVVGVVNSSTYASTSMLGSTTLGTGSLEFYVYVDEQAFDEDLPYSVAYLSVPAAADKQWGTDAYDDTVALVKERVEQVADGIAAERYEAVAGDAQRELDDARADYESERKDAEEKLDDAADELASAQRKLDDAENELADADWQLADSWNTLEDGRTQLDDSESELESAYAQLEDARKTIEDGQAEIDAGEAEYAAGVAALEEQRAELAPAIEQLPALKQQYEGILEQLKTPGLPPEQKAELEAAAAMLSEQIGQIEGGIAALDAAQAQLDAARAELDAAQAQLDLGRAEYESGLSKYLEGRAQYEQGRADYDDGVKKYESGLNDYLIGRDEYEQGRVDYEEGRKEYEENRAEADDKFADAEQELADAQADIDDIEYPSVYVLDRTKNAGAASLASDADGIAQIATFLPFMFFLVAALVSLTSMTRMVDEERIDIGTHKALGYARGRITSKYLIYGVLSSGVGSIVGILFFGQVLPWIIMTAYQVAYAVPTTPTPLDPNVTARAILLSIGVTAVATWGAAAATLRERPATLMLPRVPKAGKRIILEHIKPLWSRMSFSQKVTARNLLRYKRRFFMAVVGIAGCTALLMIGFGLRDFIGAVVSNQFGELVNYDVAVRVDGDASDETLKQVNAVYASSLVEEYTQVDDFTMIAEGPDDDLRIEVVVPQDANALEGFVTLRNRVSGEAIPLHDNEVVLTEKAANTLGLQVGDQVSLYDANDVGDKTGEGRTFTVGGIAENYLGHYAYMLPVGYRAAFDEEPAFDMAYVKLASDADPVALSDELLAIDDVSTVSFVEEKIKTYQDMLDLMTTIIFVIITLSAALAFVVLYNLTNINIAERVREIATLKVLGFTRGEVNAYIFRETIVMALIGALVGCVIGAPIALYIAGAAETPNMMFGRIMEPMSYVLSFVITMAFSVIVSFTMRHKLAKVNMVESLKSVE